MNAKKESTAPQTAPDTRARVSERRRQTIRRAEYAAHVLLEAARELSDPSLPAGRAGQLRTMVRAAWAAAEAREGNAEPDTLDVLTMIREIHLAAFFFRMTGRNLDSAARRAVGSIHALTGASLPLERVREAVEQWTDEPGRTAGKSSKFELVRRLAVDASLLNDGKPNAASLRTMYQRWPGKPPHKISRSKP